jgi:hypothetical protein
MDCRVKPDNDADVSHAERLCADPKPPWSLIVSMDHRVKPGDEK